MRARAHVGRADRCHEPPILDTTLLKCAGHRGENIVRTRVSFATYLLCANLLLVLAAGLRAQQSAPSSAAGPASMDMTVVKPETVGFSSERLERLHALMQQTVDRRELPGAVTILARHGKVTDYRVYGAKDVASNAPLSKDAIFRAFSMTKPITAVAMLQLYEQGKWLPSDPISKFIPEFAHLKVFKGADASGNMILEDPFYPPTMMELMTHTAGFTYGFLRQLDGRQGIRKGESLPIEIFAGIYRQTRQTSAYVSARHPLVLQRLHGHPGLHHRKTF